VETSTFILVVLIVILGVFLTAQIIQDNTAPGLLVSGGTAAAITGTTSTQVIVGKANYYLNITSVLVTDSSTANTQVELQDGYAGTVIWPGGYTCQTGFHGYFEYPVPLRVPTLGNGLYAVDVTTGASVLVSAVGYYSKY
jgi:hypothetical protein